MSEEPESPATHPFQLQECKFVEHRGPSGNWTTIARFRTLMEAQKRFKNTVTNWTCLRVHVTPEDASEAILEAQRAEQAREREALEERGPSAISLPRTCEDRPNPAKPWCKQCGAEHRVDCICNDP